MNKFIIFAGILVIIAAGYLWLNFSDKKTASPISIIPSPDPGKTVSIPDIPQITVLAQNLDTPWSIVFLPDKSMLVTERPGSVRYIDKNGNLQTEPVAVIKNVAEIGEGGLLGITIHPKFTENNFVYLYYTYSGNNNGTLNRVVRMTYQYGQLSNERIIIDDIPGASNHNGGRIKFGPDGYLYATTGEAENPSQAQDTNALGGKILRVTDEGKPVQDNPFNNLVYSYGHRNPQGLAWDAKGQLWSTEHGPSGGQYGTGNDELNLIEKGKNYGWPVIQGDEKRIGMETPRLNSGPYTTWAPAGAAFVGDTLFFGGLRGQTLYEVNTNENKMTLKEHFSTQFGRIRDVVLGPDNLLYITTSNRDGRGSPGPSDDRIIKINPRKI